MDKETHKNCIDFDYIYTTDNLKICSQCNYIYKEPTVRTCELDHLWVETNEQLYCPWCKLLATSRDRVQEFVTQIKKLQNKGCNYKTIADIFSVDTKRIDNVLYNYRTSINIEK